MNDGDFNLDPGLDQEGRDDKSVFVQAKCKVRLKRS